MLSLQCVFVFCQSPMVEPKFEDDDPDNRSSRRAALLCFAGAERKVCRVLECVVCWWQRHLQCGRCWMHVLEDCYVLMFNHVCVCVCVCVRVHYVPLEECDLP